MAKLNMNILVIFIIIVMIKIIANKPISMLSSSSLIKRVFLSFCSSFSVFDSQYHHKGALPFKRPKKIEALMSNINRELDSKIKQVQQQRSILNKANITISSAEQYHNLKSKNQDMQKYLHAYLALTKIVQKCELNNEWIFKFIGWYNLTHYYKPLIGRLLESQQDQREVLIDALSWMKYQWKNAYGLIDQQLRTDRKIQHFYRRLSVYLNIKHLRKLENILITPLVITKRNFYEQYAARHLQNWLKLTNTEDKQGVDDIIWLFERCIINMMDQQYIVSKIQKYLLTNKMNLSNENMQRLINAYSLKGRININIYQEYIKPYILREKMKNLSNIIQSIQFVICSQCKDDALLKNLYQMLEIHYQSNKLRLQNSRDKYYLHLYTHYLRVKGYRIKLNLSLQKELNDFCKQKAQGRESINKIVYQHRSKQSKDKNKYISQCLNTKQYTLKQYDATKTSVFQQTFKNKLQHTHLNEMKIYQKPIFCCFQLDFCLHKVEENELTDIQIDGMQYVFGSGRLIRSREIRDQILQFYGLKIHHIDYNSFKFKPKPFDQQLLTKKLFPKRK